MIFIATLLNIEKDCNPEVCWLSVEAEDELAAKKKAQEVLKGDLHGLGWTSHRDTELWGKEQRVLVDVVPESDDMKRRGRGNSSGEEGQDAREARFRKAAKV